MFLSRLGILMRDFSPPLLADDRLYFVARLGNGTLSSPEPALLFASDHYYDQ